MRQCEQLERDKRELLRQVVELGERGREEGEEGQRLRGKVRAGHWCRRAWLSARAPPSGDRAGAAAGGKEGGGRLLGRPAEDSSDPPQR